MQFIFYGCESVLFLCHAECYIPEGFDNIPPHRKEKVRLGNTLAQVAARLAEAQEKALNFWTSRAADDVTHVAL